MECFMLLTPETEKQVDGSLCWLKRLGWLGFCFFLVKGLLWLTVPALLVYFGSGA